jgi:hypothetical protein
MPLLAARITSELGEEQTTGDTGLSEALGVLVRECDRMRTDKAAKPIPGFDSAVLDSLHVRTYPGAEPYPRHAWAVAAPTTLDEGSFAALLDENAQGEE